MVNIEFKQNEMCRENHLVDSTRLGLVATKKLSVSKKLVANYRIIELASSEWLKNIEESSLFVKQISTR